MRRYLRDEQAARYKQREPRPTKLDPFKSYLLERVVAARPHWIPATVLLRELREAGYEGGISQLKAFLAPCKRAEPEPVVRFETPPGKQMQADFTVIRRGRTPLLALVATLGYSRASFVRFTAGEDAATLCECLREAFVYFGGTPEQVLFDSLLFALKCMAEYCRSDYNQNAQHKREVRGQPGTRLPVPA